MKEFLASLAIIVLVLFGCDHLLMEAKKRKQTHALNLVTELGVGTNALSLVVPEGKRFQLVLSTTNSESVGWVDISRKGEKIEMVEFDVSKLPIVRWPATTNGPAHLIVDPEGVISNKFLKVSGTRQVLDLLVVIGGTEFSGGLFVSYLQSLHDLESGVVVREEVK